MKRFATLTLFIVLALSLGATALAQDTVELDFMCYQDGSE